MVHPNVTNFIKENGDHVMNDAGGLWIFETGATRENCPYGCLTPAFKAGDPQVTPDMIRNTLRMKLYFAQKKFGATIRALETLKKELLERTNDAYTNAAMPPSKEEIDKLHELKDTRDKFQALTETAELELNPPPPPPTAQQLQRDALVREKSQAVRDEIRSIEV